MVSVGRCVSHLVSILGLVASRPTTPTFSHTGQVLARAVTFQFALDPNVQQNVLLAKCAGARRFTVNHHLARVKTDLDAPSAEREAHSESGASPEPSTPSLSGSASSFINEGGAWKNGEADHSPLNEDGSCSLVWRHELPHDVFECASVDAARALENFSASRRGEQIFSSEGPRHIGVSNIRWFGIHGTNLLSWSIPTDHLGKRPSCVQTGPPDSRPTFEASNRHRHQ